MESTIRIFLFFKLKIIFSLVLIGFFFIVAKSQCLKDSINLKSFEIDTVYYYSKLEIKNEKLYPLLNDIMNYIDKFNFNKDSVGIYFQINVTEVNEKKSIRLCLMQRMYDFESSNFDYWDNSHSFYGAFCYNNYLFMVRARNLPPPYIDQIFNKTEDLIACTVYKYNKNHVKYNNITDKPFFYEKYYEYNNGMFKFTKKYEFE